MFIILLLLTCCLESSRRGEGVNATEVLIAAIERNDHEVAQRPVADTIIPSVQVP